jgi:hypothetical protein
MALRNSSDQKGCPQLALQSLENQSRFSTFWLIKKEVVFDQMRGERIVFATIHATLLLLPISDRSLPYSCDGCVDSPGSWVVLQKLTGV